MKAWTAWTLGRPGCGPAATPLSLAYLEWVLSVLC